MHTCHWLLVQSVGNVFRVMLNQEEIESNMETGVEIIKSRMEKEGERTKFNVETKGNGKKMSSQHGDKEKRK